MNALVFLAALGLALASVVAVVFILVQAGKQVADKVLEHARGTLMVGGQPLALAERSADLQAMKLEIEKAREDVRGDIARARANHAAPPLDVHN